MKKKNQKPNAMPKGMIKKTGAYDTKYIYWSKNHTHELLNLNWIRNIMIKCAGTPNVHWARPFVDVRVQVASVRGSTNKKKSRRMCFTRKK